MKFLLNNKKKSFYLFFLIIFIIHQLIFQNNLVFDNYLIAEEYKGIIPNLVFGKIWFMKNHLFEAPHFAAHLCGGTPFYADPQSLYYSPIQIVFILFDLVFSIKLTFFIFSFLTYLGSYYLLKESFKFNNYISLIGATLFLFNGFFVNRALVGHLSYMYLGLIPLYCLIVIKSYENFNFYLRVIIIIISSLLLTMLMYGGALPLVIIIIYSIVSIILLYSIKYNNNKIFLTLSYSLILSFLLSISKIVYSLNYLINFPRNIDGIILKNFFNFIYTFLTSLFLVPDPIYYHQNEYNINKVYIYLHELEYGLSILPLLLIVYYLFFFRKKMLAEYKIFKFNIQYILLIILLILPISFQIFIPYVSNLLDKIPFFSSIWVRARWLYIYIFPIIFLTCLIIDRIKLKKIFIIFLIFIPIAQTLLYHTARNYFFPNKSFAKKATYNVENLSKFSDSLSKKNIDDIKITKVEHDSDFTKMDLNEGFITNTSKILCYLPILGYKLEKLPIKNITGDKLEYLSLIKNSKKNYNLFDPTCFLFPKENNCKVGDLFKSDDKNQIYNFLNNKPIKFKISNIQKYANSLNFVIFILTFIILFICAIKYIINKLNFKKPSLN
jgi:hypothetical protein